jgi:HAD superfamily hydrolase (TIGR01549 family)
MRRTTDRAVIFDLDGTLALCGSTGDRITTILLEYGAPGTRSELRRAVSATNSDWTLVETCVPEHARAEAYDEICRVNAAVVATSECDAGIAPMLAALASDYRLFMLSGRDATSLQLVLERHHLSSYFESIVADGRGVSEKPDPRSCMELLARHGLASGQATYIGDKDVDLELARRARIGFVGVMWYGDRLRAVCTRVATPAELPLVLAQTYRARSAEVLRTISSHE